MNREEVRCKEIQYILEQLESQVQASLIEVFHRIIGPWVKFRPANPLHQ